MCKGKKVKHINLKALRKKAWSLQSEYIRRLAQGKCFTCGDTKDWKKQQAGHYIHKDCLDYDPININCQCVRCNKWLHGNSGAYAERLIAEYGEQAVAELRVRAEKIKKFTISELETLIDYYTVKLEELNGEKGLS